MSIAQRLYFVLAIMVLLITGELSALWFTIHTLSAVRAYVEGEGLWSKAEKDAVFHLATYGRNSDPAQYAAYLTFLRISHGDRSARLELTKPVPDRRVEFEGFREGGNDPDDIPGMIGLFTNFGRVSYIAQAIDDWTAADTAMMSLEALGMRLHEEIERRADTAERNRTLADIALVNGRLTVLEDHFSATLGAGSRWLTGLVLKVLLAAALTVELTGLILTVAVTRGISARLNAMLGAVDRVARGDHSVRMAAAGNDEIDRLAHSLNQMTDDLSREHRVAGTFQHAALPASLPEIPGLKFDGMYVPAQSDERVGGDWYDALRLSDGRVVISIGDVAGSGLGAAVIMAAMRQVIRGVAQIHADPAAMLDAADRTLKAEHPDRQVTAFVGIFDPISATISYASAGHPRPLVRNADGSVLELPATALPLGLRVRGDGLVQTRDVAAGSMMVFYTDGLTEANRDPLDGERRLRAFLSGGLRVTDQPSRAIYDAMLPQGTHDDVAILTLRTERRALERRTGESPQFCWTFSTDDAGAAGRARLEFPEAVAARSASPEAVYSAELVFGELVANVVRYAAGQVRVVLDCSNNAPVLHVLDEGAGFTFAPHLPNDVLSERGRGLFLAWALTEDFNVTARATRGSHARAVLCLKR